MAGFFEALEPRRLLSAAPPVPVPPPGLTPAQVRHAYGFDQAYFLNAKGKPIPADGAGQTIAIITAYRAPTLAKDLKVFSKAFGLHTTPVSIATPQGKPGFNADWANETTMDVELAHAIAPGAKILVVEAKTQSPADLLNAVDYARHRKGVTVVSMSWGWDTPPQMSAGLFTTPPHHVGKSRGDGVTFVSAADDHGLATAWPDPSTGIITVGGTTLTLDSANNYAAESALPASVQPASVAYNANPTTGFTFYDSTPDQGRVGWQSAGGTSAGAPQWAALIAIADQGRTLHHKPSLDGPTQAVPALNSLPASDFHIITGATSAQGRGSPFADRVIADLVTV